MVVRSLLLDLARSETSFSLTNNDNKRVLIRLARISSEWTSGPPPPDPTYVPLGI